MTIENPPAFPVTAENGLGHVSDGMTLRDWFAGQALVGIVSRGLPSDVLRRREAGEVTAAVAYGIADALLLARATPSIARKDGE